MSLSIRVCSMALSAFIALTAFASVGFAQAGAATTAARTKVNEAQEAVNAVKKEIGAMRMRVQTTFDGKAQWATGQARFNKAQQSYDAAIAKAKAALANNADYKALTTRRDQAKLALDNSSGADDATLQKFAKEVTDCGLAMKKMETDTVESNQEVVNAKQDLENARKDLADLDGLVTAALMLDPEYIAAQKRLSAAEEQLTQARQQLADAVKADAASKRKPVAPKTPSRPRTK